MHVLIYIFILSFFFIVKAKIVVVHTLRINMFGHDLNFFGHIIAKLDFLVFTRCFKITR